MDNLKLDAIGIHKCTLFQIVTNNASWTDDQSLIQRRRRFRVKPSLTSDLIWTALVQQKLLLNRGQGHVWTWFKLDRRWWNAPWVIEDRFRLSERLMLLVDAWNRCPSTCLPISYASVISDTQSCFLSVHFTC